MLAEDFTRGRWLLLCRGMTAGLLGFLLLGWPRLSLATLAVLFGVYALVDGLSSLMCAGLKRTICADWRLTGVQGLAGIAIGFIVFGHPGMTAPYLLTQIALRTVAVSGIDGIAGIILLEETQREWLLFLSAIAPALIALLVLTQLGAGPLAAHWYLAMSSIIASLFFLALAFRMRTCADRLQR